MYGDELSILNAVDKWSMDIERNWYRFPIKSSIWQHRRISFLLMILMGSIVCPCPARASEFLSCDAVSQTGIHCIWISQSNSRWLERRARIVYPIVARLTKDEKRSPTRITEPSIFFSKVLRSYKHVLSHPFSHSLTMITEKPCHRWNMIIGRKWEGGGLLRMFHHFINIGTDQLDEWKGHFTIW